MSDMRDLVVEMLESQGVPVLAQAEDGQEAVRLARDLEIDVVVMDLSMPFVGGLEATRILHSFRPQTKVVIFTMFEDEYDRAAALEAGAVAYLIKDDAFRELAEVILRVHAEPPVAGGRPEERPAQAG